MVLALMEVEFIVGLVKGGQKQGCSSGGSLAVNRGFRDLIGGGVSQQ